MPVMPGTRPQPLADHPQHDPLLIAQLAAGDALPAEQHAEATRLLASCPECARLAADLAVIARAVAQEPVPPRRRDFRFDAERAARLRGSPLTRFLRGLSAPRLGTLRPVAAGALSLGLVFMLAGTVVPRLAGPSAQLAPVAEPAAATAPPHDVSGGDAEASTAGVMEDAAPAADAAAVPEQSDPAGLELDVLGADTPVDRGLGSAPSAPADDSTVRSKAMVPEGGDTGVAGGDTSAAGELEYGVTPPASTVAPLAAMAMEAAPTNGALTEPAAASGVALSTTEDGSATGTLLTIAGAALVLLGALLLGLLWLTRRVRDPLLG
jgi:hypothetical protein